MLGRLGEVGIVCRQIDLPQEAVGSLDGGDPGESQFLRQPVLQRPERPLRAAARLRGIGGDVLDAELPKRPADLGQILLRDLAAGLRGVEVVPAAIGVEAAPQPEPA